MTEPFAATITVDGVDTNRTGHLTDAELAAIEKLRMAGRIVTKHGASPVGMRLKLIPCRELKNA